MDPPGIFPQHGASVERRRAASANSTNKRHRDRIPTKLHIRGGHRGTLPPFSLEARHEGFSILSNRSCSLLLFAVGHTLGFRQSDPTWGVDTLLGSMRSIHFDVQGFSRTYWDLFVAAGFSVGVFYLFAAVLVVAARWSCGRDFGGLAPHSVGSRSFPLPPSRS